MSLTAPERETVITFSDGDDTATIHTHQRRIITKLKNNPAAEEAGAEWAAFHTLRHTFASLHIARGTNIVQLSRMLGHHSPDFTLRVYAHLIPGDKVAALDLEQELSARPAVAHIGMALGSSTDSGRNGTPENDEARSLAGLS